jgi:hypothetical protein
MLGFQILCPVAQLQPPSQGRIMDQKVNSYRLPCFVTLCHGKWRQVGKTPATKHMSIIAQRGRAGKNGNNPRFFARGKSAFLVAAPRPFFIDPVGNQKPARVRGWVISPMPKLFGFDTRQLAEAYQEPAIRTDLTTSTVRHRRNRPVHTPLSRSAVLTSHEMTSVASLPAKTKSGEDGRLGFVRVDDWNESWHFTEKPNGRKGSVARFLKPAFGPRGSSRWLPIAVFIPDDRDAAGWRCGCRASTSVRA